MKVTKTINPLHFEDLEPHRFEDLIRQLIYDFKDWKSIEATGRLGSDDGIDILAIENYFVENTEEGENNYKNEGRVWIIQCKREQILSAKKVSQIVESDIGKQSEIPFGYILASSANFSKKTRDAFKICLNSLGVKEFYIFGKAEIEDLLFQPKYDHLLFAYFGISLQKRRTSIKSNLSTRLITKKKLIKTIGDFDNIEHKNVFVRPAHSDQYPKIIDQKKVQWKFYEAFIYKPVDCISLITKSHYAYVDWESKSWDILEEYDTSFRRYPEIYDFDYEVYDQENESVGRSVQEKWDKLDENNKGIFLEIRPIHFDRIVLIDEIGDTYNEAPHLVVDYLNNSPFENRKFTFIRSIDNYLQRILYESDLDNRIKYF